ncbi:MAG: DEAD/DEAH box helicase [Candidatus Thorarchaeota archaeon]|nr:DEAD/DEAH box helicase [Candidatus Thorarchaeota archaeon]
MKRLHPDIARVIRALGVLEFNEVQKAAAKGGLYTKPGDYALVSQSRTGKSFAGTLLVANEMFKCISAEPDTSALSIIVAPFHASARETSNLVSQLFGWFLRPLVLIGEVRQSEIIVRLSKGLAPNVIIATPGALQDIIRMEESRDWLLSKKILTIVFDDVHSILHDPARGSMLLELSDFFRICVSPRPRVLFLSAVFDEPQRLEKLFGVKLIQDTTDYQPPTINLVKYKSTGEKDQKLAELLEELAEQGQRTLVYMKIISNIEKMLVEKGDDITEFVTYDLDPLVRSRLEKVAKILDELDYPHSEFITRGIGCYHGQLDEEHRWFVEWAFRRKHLRFLFGTEALAYGVNTPVSHVVMESPGIDEIFRQSMMARAVRLRRGHGKPGTCTVFTKTIEDEEALNRVYFSPKLPIRFLSDNNLTRLLLGMIGLGLLRTESDRKKISDRLGLLFKKGSTELSIKNLSKGIYPLVEKSKKGDVSLTPLGQLVFNSGLSAEQSEIIIDGLQLIAEGICKPTEFDLLLLLNAGSILERESGKTKKQLDDTLQSYLLSSVKSVILSKVIDTKAEETWRVPIEYSSLILKHTSENIEFEHSIRKSATRLLLELRMFIPNFRSFLEDLKTERIMGDRTNINQIIDDTLSLLDSKRFCEKIFGSDKGESSLSGKDLSFVDFGDIESSIDATLKSNLTPLQKIQLLDLLDTVENTTSAFVDLLSKSQEDEESKLALDTVLRFSKEGHVGGNLLKALEEEGIVERGTLDNLMNIFSKRVDEIQHRTDAPAKAAKVLLALFSGDVIGLTTGGINALRLVLGRARGRVDTRGLS